MAQTIQSDNTDDSNNLPTDTTTSLPSTNPADKGTGYVNLGKILAANQGSQLGQSLSNQTQGIAQTTGSNIQQAGQAFNTASNQAFQPYSGGQQFIQNTLANPTGLSQNAINQFQTVAGGQYTGPQTLTDANNPLTNTTNAQNLQSGISNLQNQAQLGQSFGGTQALLGSLFNGSGGGSYGLGSSALDAAVLRQDPTQSGALTQLGQTANTLGQQYTAATGQAAQQAAYNQAQAQTLGAQATQGLAGAQATQTQQQNAALAAAQQQQATNAALFGQTTNEFGGNTFSQADLARLGLTNVINSNTDLFNLNPASYLQTNITAAPTSTAQTTSQAQAAQINALANLGGQGPVYSDLTQVGNYNPSTQSFNTTGFEAAQQAAQSGYTSAENSLQRLALQRLLMYPGQTAGEVTNNPGVSGIIGNLGNVAPMIASGVAYLPNMITNSIGGPVASLGKVVSGGVQTTFGAPSQAAAGALQGNQAPTITGQEATAAIPGYGAPVAVAENPQATAAPSTLESGGQINTAATTAFGPTAAPANQQPLANQFASTDNTRYLYGDIAQDQLQQAVNQYGSLAAAAQAVGATPQSANYSTNTDAILSQEIQQTINAINAMGYGNNANIVGGYASDGNAATPAIYPTTPTPAQVISAINGSNLTNSG